MAIVTSSQILMESASELLVKFNRSQGKSDADETNELKVDVSALTPPCSTVKITEAWFSTNFQAVSIIWDATVKVESFALGGPGCNSYLDFRDFGGLVNNADGGLTGDVLFSTFGDKQNYSYYSIILNCAKVL